MSRAAKLAACCAATALLGAAPALGDAALDAALRQWRSAGLASYEYGYHKFCECHRESPPETLVRIAAGKVVDVRHRPAGSQVEVPGRNFEEYWTVDELFELVRSAEQRGAEVRASYDAALGFPREIYIDYDRDFIGDELDLRLTAVRPLTQ